MSDIETQAAEMVRKAQNGFLNMEDLLIEAAHRVATQQERNRWDNNCVNVTPLFAAKFLVRKGVSFQTVCQMSS